MRISDWSSDVCSSDLTRQQDRHGCLRPVALGRRTAAGGSADRRDVRPGQGLCLNGEMTELSKPRKQYRDLRSARWMAPDDFRSFGHRSRTMQMGYAPEDWEGKPIVAILNTWSDAQPCPDRKSTRLNSSH